MSFLSKLFASTELNTVSLKDKKNIKTDLSRLNSLQKGLGDDAVQHVLQGDRDSVLVALTQHQTEAAKIVEFESYWNKNKVIEKAMEARWSYLHQGNFNPGIWMRYGQLLVAAGLDNSTKINYAPGSGNVPSWLRIILYQFLNLHAYYYYKNRKNKNISSEAELSIDNLFALAAADESRTEDQIKADVVDCLYHEDNSWGRKKFEQINEMSGYQTFINAAIPAVVEAGTRIGAAGRAHLIADLLNHGFCDNPLCLDFAFQQGFGSVKTVSKKVQPLLFALDKQAITEYTQSYLQKGNSTQRAEAARFLAHALKDEACELLKKHNETEKSKRVIDTIEGLLSSLTAMGDYLKSQQVGNGYLAVDGTTVKIPEKPEVPVNAGFGNDAADLTLEAIQQYNTVAKKLIKSAKKNKQNTKYQLIPERNASMIVKYLSSKSIFVPANAKIKPYYQTLATDYYRSGSGLIMKKILANASFSVWCQLTAPFKVNDYLDHGTLNLILSEDFYHTPPSVPYLLNYLSDGGDFRCIAAELAKHNVPIENHLIHYLTSRYWNMSLDFESVSSESLWPYFAEHLNHLDKAFGLGTDGQNKQYHLSHALKILQLLPKTPQSFLMPLMQLATTPSKRYRQEARDLLEGAKGINEQIIAQFKDGKQDIRAGAAAWAAERDITAAIEPLHSVLKKERSELPRAAFISALKKLGADISQYMDKEKLLAEAETGLKKVKPKNLDWFPFEALPNLKFKSADEINPVILKWWIVSANKLKQPEGNRLYDLYLDELAEGDAARLGEFILNAFIIEDTRCATNAEAVAYAEEYADTRYQQWKQWDKEITRDKVFANLKREKLGEYLSSASNNRGILGLAVRTSGTDAAQHIRAYLKKHGARVSQSKALINCLAANPSPAAIQLVLSVANRHKQKTVQALAAELIESIAEQRDWTADQLADRTIPTGGLNEAGILELPCGSEDKVYQALFDGKDKLILKNPTGKIVKAIPAPKGGDETIDAEIKASRKALSDARKEIKQVVALQSSRLYEAMCSGRIWDATEWHEYIRRHPIVSHFAQRLVWQGLDENDKATLSFRVMDDGGLTDFSDEDVAITKVARVQLAHSALLAKEDSQQWLAHFTDYEITPLFPQLDRPLLEVSSEMTKATKIEDRCGWVMDFYKMQSMSNKLGYANGQPEDAGFYYTWEKEFPSSGLKAIIEFSGACAGAREDNEKAAVKELYFVVKGGRRQLKLADVPAVLLSECWSDYRAIADSGEFNTDWEKQVSW